MRNGKVYGKFVLTVYVFDSVQFCIFVAYSKETDTASLFTIDIIEKIICIKLF